MSLGLDRIFNKKSKIYSKKQRRTYQARRCFSLISRGNFSEIGEFAT